jgi:hypothetical protein
MTRREMLNSCLSGCVSGSLILASGLLSAQQPGRATLNPRRDATLPSEPAAQQPGGQPRVERPSPASMEALPAELEDLLVQWEVKSANIHRLRGDFMRYVYDMVYLGETRAVGRFFYEAPDQGRMDFGPRSNDEVPPRTDEQKGQFTLQPQSKERWICNGKEVFIIDDDKRLFDLVHIPLQQQGRNIMNGPLPFLFGMKAEQAKARYSLQLGDRHWPNGAIVTEKEKQVRKDPQYHIIALPRHLDDRREWRRAEVVLTPDFLPMAIKLFSATGQKETVYLFFPGRAMWVNERLWIPNPNPFNDRPPAGYVKASENRATDEETVAGEKRVLPAARQKLNR